MSSALLLSNPLLLDVFLQCSKPNDESAFGSVISELRTPAVPGGMTDLLLAFHFICGGNSVSACLLSVELEQRSPTSISRNIIWSLPDSDKAVGASALSNTSWSHQTIKIPRTETESQVIIRTEYNYLDGGGIGLDNIVLSSSRQCSHTWRRVPGYELETEFDQFWRLVPRYSH